jgi:hypothetical protein
MINPCFASGNLCREGREIFLDILFFVRLTKVDCANLQKNGGSAKMSFLQKRESYKGVLRLRGGSVSNHGKDSRKYSTISVGLQELNDIVVPRYFEKLLVQGEEIELTLSRASRGAFMFFIIGALLLFAGEILEFNELLMVGVPVFFVSMIYWVASFINAGHEISSVRIKGVLHSGHGEVEYGAPAQPVDKQPVQQESAAKLMIENAHEASITTSIKTAEVSEDSTFDTKNNTESSVTLRENTTELAHVFNSRILGVTRLVCPQCESEALVMPETNVICGDCRVWMRVEN